MKLTDIGFHPGPGLDGPLHRIAHIADSLRRELALRAVDAPFRKLAVALTTSSTREWCWEGPVDGVLESTGRVDAAILSAPYEAMKMGVLDATEQAVRRAATRLPWCADAVLAVVAELRARPQLHGYELGRLARLHRPSGRRARVFFRMTETDSAVIVRIEQGGDPVADIVVAHREGPMPVELWWPVARSAMAGDELVLRDGKGTELGRVRVAARA